MPSSDSLVERMRHAGDALTSSERLLAEYILRHPAAPAFMAAARFGQEAGVSESTVVRFARTLGFAGFPEMQRFAQEHLERRLDISTTERFANGIQSAGSARLAPVAFQTDLENLRLTARALNPDQLEGVADRLIQARRTYVMGSRWSAGVSHFLATSLSILLSDVHNLVFSADGLPEGLLGAGPDDVGITVSFARPSQRTVQAARLIRESGGTVIAVTDSLSNALAREANEVLLAFTHSVAYVQSYTAVYALCHALVATVGRKVSDRAELHLQRLESILTRYGFVETE